MVGYIVSMVFFNQLWRSFYEAQDKLVGRTLNLDKVATMLQMPDSGNQVFEVRVYNKQVRALVKENQHHQKNDDVGFL